MFLVSRLADFVKHLAETSHGLKTRSGRPHISSERPFSFAERQNAPVERFEWRRPLRQRNGKNGVHQRAGKTLFPLSGRAKQPGR